MTEQQQGMMTATFEGVVKWSGGRAVMKKGMTFADSHPLVTERPELFAREEATVDVRAPEPPVERGTHGPGEVRAEIAVPGRRRRTA